MHCLDYMHTQCVHSCLTLFTAIQYIYDCKRSIISEQHKISSLCPTFNQTRKMFDCQIQCKFACETPQLASYRIILENQRNTSTTLRKGTVGCPVLLPCTESNSGLIQIQPLNQAGEVLPSVDLGCPHETDNLPTDLMNNSTGVSDIPNVEMPALDGNSSNSGSANRSENKEFYISKSIGRYANHTRVLRLTKYFN